LQPRGFKISALWQQNFSAAATARQNCSGVEAARNKISAAIVLLQQRATKFQRCCNSASAARSAK
jgi:hypothetical protein